MGEEERGKGFVWKQGGWKREVAQKHKIKGERKKIMTAKSLRASIQ
jgi:hypothetical protein